MEKEYVVKLDVYLGVLEARVINFNQLNTGTCKLGFELTSNKQALDLTAQKVTFEVTTPGGSTLEDAILITDATQGKAECTLANDMIAEQGVHYAEINVYSKNNTKLLTFNKFRYIVNGQLGGKDITVDTRYSTLQELIFDVENLKNQSVIDTETVTQMKNETDLMHKDVIVKHGEVEVKHQEVVTLAQSVKDDASRTASNAQQVSTDKGIVTKSKNEVVAKHEEVLKTAGVIAQDKAIVEQAKTETLGYKNDVETMKNDVQQLVTDSTEDLILEGNRQVVRVSTEGTTQVDLAKAEVAKATQQATVATEQATIATTKSEEATTQADRATREADRAVAQAQEKVNSKIGLNGVHDDTIFNFIGDKGNAIKELHTTDSTGKTSILKLASNTDHVEDRSGRTQGQINRTFYKRMCKEIPSPSGEPITVKNGEEGYVLSAEIKGNTQLFKRAKGSQDEWIVIPNDEGRDTVAFEYKLDSTQAIISNNGEPYPIYANEEDKANKKVISLPFAEDKMMLNVDGSVTWVNASTTIETKNFTWSKDISSNDEYFVGKITVPNTSFAQTEFNVISDILDSEKGTLINTYKGEKCVIGGWNNVIVIKIKSNFLSSNDVTGFNTWIKDNNPILTYKLNPTSVSIPKELVPTILTQQTNILEVGGAVKPSSFKVTVPVDRLAEIEARLQALESTTVDVVLNK